MKTRKKLQISIVNKTPYSNKNNSFKNVIVFLLKNSIPFSIIIIISMIGISIVIADTLETDDQVSFDAGIYDSTVYNSIDGVLELDGTGKTLGVGSYISEVFDLSTVSQWNSIGWSPIAPYGKELPNDSQIETAYTEGNIDMSNNMLLMHMDENSGNIIDFSGQNNHGFPSGGLTYNVAGKFDSALEFDGVNDYIAISNLNYSSPNQIQNLTVSAWVKVPPGGGNWSIIDFDRSEYFTVAAGVPNGSANGDGDYVAFHTNANGTGINDMWSSTSIRDNQWHHIAVVFDSSQTNDKKIYIDGQLDSQIDAYPNGIGLGSGVTRYGFIGDGSEAGSFDAGRNNLYYEGAIDELSLWHRSLDDQEIENLYRRGINRLKIQVRSCDDALCAGESLEGYDGSSSTYFSESQNSNLTLPQFNFLDVDDNQYFQYRIVFETDDVGYSPRIQNIGFDYTALINYPPDKPTNDSPANESTGIGENPNLIASFYSDTESNPHSDTEWIVDDDIDFSSPVWIRNAGSGEIFVKVSDTTGTFQNELNGQNSLNQASEYYWRVRYFDGNVWSEYSNPTSFVTFSLDTGDEENNESNPAVQPVYVPQEFSSTFDNQVGSSLSCENSISISECISYAISTNSEILGIAERLEEISNIQVDDSIRISESDFNYIPLIISIVAGVIIISLSNMYIIKNQDRIIEYIER